MQIKIKFILAKHNMILQIETNWKLELNLIERDSDSNLDKDSKREAERERDRDIVVLSKSFKQIAFSLPNLKAYLKIH